VDAVDRTLSEIPVATYPVERFRELLGDGWGEVEEALATARAVFEGRVLWHVNSTARGGGVVELLTSLLAYTRGAGVDARWIVIEGNPEFFALTKLIHNNLHGWGGDGVVGDGPAHELYNATLAPCAEELRRRVAPGDVVYCHDPQTAGLVKPMVDAGAIVVWRCHVGVDEPNDTVRAAWRFLEPYVSEAHACVFSRREFVWDGIGADRVWIVPPSIDAFSPKNQDLDADVVEAILAATGIAPPGASAAAPVFTRGDGSPARVDRRSELDQERPVATGSRLISQVSRWDRLKDPIGVITGFAEHADAIDAELLLAGPSVAAVSDDPEGAQVLAQVRELRAGLAPEIRERVHLACLPMDDVEENAAIVNAIQRRSTIVVQKSLAEGFGLTVAEAMWKGKPMVASRAGGIQDQIVDGVTGILLSDPTDLDAFAAALAGLLDDPTRAAEIGVAAREWVISHFLGSRHLLQYMRLLADLLRRDVESS